MMKKLSQLNEARPSSTSKIIKVSASAWDKWEKFLGKKLSSDFYKLNEILKSNGINSSEYWDKLRFGNASEQRNTGKSLGLDVSDIAEIAALIKKIGGEANAIPMSISDAARESIMSNPKLLDEILVDRQSDKGVAATIKQYTPMINKLVYKYSAVTPFDKAELTSICKVALYDAVRKYMRGDKATEMQFTGFLQFMMFQAIQNELHENGYTIRMPQSEQMRLLSAGSVNKVNSYDAIVGSDGDDYDTDKLAFLGFSDDKVNNNEDPEKFKMLMDIIERQFGTQKAEVFYMHFGVNGYKKTPGKDIAKKIGKSPALVVKICNEIISWLKSKLGNGQIGALIDYLNDVYVEGLIATNFYVDKNEFYNTISNDELYIMIQEAQSMKIDSERVRMVLDEIDAQSSYFISQCLTNGYEWMDKNYRRNKMIIINFLSLLYPAQDFEKFSDVQILDMMRGIIDLKIKL